MLHPALVLAVVLFLAAPVGAASVLLSEVLPDPDGRDDGRVFVELWGSPGTRLDGWRLVGRNGRGGAITHEVDLTGAVIGPSGFLVVADGSGGVTEVPFADLVSDDLDLQNGPDSVLLLRGTEVIDALAYGVFGPDLVAFGEGDPAPRPSGGFSLARPLADVDTNDNRRDFVLLAEPTPGRGRTLPEPGAWVLLAVGAAVLLVRLGIRS
jgi:hypothetical protein